MIMGLRGATIWSEDLKGLLPFYRDVLGLPVTVDTLGDLQGSRGKHASAATVRPGRLNWADDRSFVT